MIVHSESMSRNVNLYGRLSALAISGVEELVRRQLDYASLLVEQNSHRWHRMSAQASGALTPEQWSRLMRDGIESAVEAMRDGMAATGEHHAEVLRTLHHNFARTQDALVEALEGFAASRTADAETSRRGRTGAARTSTPQEKRTA